MALKWIGRFNRHGFAGLEEVLRSGRPRVDGPEDVGAVIQAALTPPQELELPFAFWTLDRLVAYLKEEKVLLVAGRVAELPVAVHVDAAAVEAGGAEQVAA